MIPVVQFEVSKSDRRLTTLLKPVYHQSNSLQPIRYSSYSSRPSFESKKLYVSADEAIRDLSSNSVLLSGGFGLCGTPDTLIQALSKRPDVKNLTVVSNNAGLDSLGLGILIKSGQISKMISSYIGANKHFEKLYLDGKISLELAPQGTLAERCRAGAAGIPAFYTPTGYGTPVETGSIPIRYNSDDPSKVDIPGNPREVREFEGRNYLLERSIKADYAFIHVWKADRFGNCIFRYSAQNFSGVMARNARMTIVEAEEIVEIGQLDPNEIHLPGVFVNRIVPATSEKRIEKIVLRSEPSSDSTANSDRSSSSDSAQKDPKLLAKKKRELIVRRAAMELRDGMHVNLGIGMPMLAPDFLEQGTTIHMQSENGILRMGPYPTPEQVDGDIVNAGKETTTLLPGASTFDSSESFAMIRGGHIDVSILGAMQVSKTGDLANFMIPGKSVKGMGGAMDLVSNPESTKVIIVMEHCDKYGASKLVDQCSLPLTGVRCVSQVITELAVFDIDRSVGKMRLSELQPGISLDEVKQKTDAEFEISSSLKQI
ncbi:succinyl-CoA:3-ketoacid-coenzyme A transferase subunit A [Phakopsora pachyrhizi]|nr:succinyl-CoA:3-ketoacid-coenzyme A transferase subunit A [Phakopsora pachyrhizi]